MYARSTRCVAVNYEVLVTLHSVCIWAEKTSLFSIFRITNNSFSNKIQNPIHFEIQKSTLKSRNPEIHVKYTEIQSEIRNLREIQWISKSRTPRRAVADMGGLLVRN